MRDQSPKEFYKLHQPSRVFSRSYRKVIFKEISMCLFTYNCHYPQSYYGTPQRLWWVPQRELVANATGLIPIGSASCSNAKVTFTKIQAAYNDVDSKLHNEDRFPSASIITTETIEPCAEKREESSTTNWHTYRTDCSQVALLAKRLQPRPHGDPSTTNIAVCFAGVYIFLPCKVCLQGGQHHLSSYHTSASLWQQSIKLQRPLLSDVKGCS